MRGKGSGLSPRLARGRERPVLCKRRSFRGRKSWRKGVGGGGDQMSFRKKSTPGLFLQFQHQEDPSFAFLQLLVLLLLFSIKKSKNYESTDYL